MIPLRNTCPSLYQGQLQALYRDRESYFSRLPLELVDLVFNCVSFSAQEEWVRNFQSWPELPRSPGATWPHYYVKLLGTVEVGKTSLAVRAVTGEWHTALPIRERNVCCRYRFGQDDIQIMIVDDFEERFLIPSRDYCRYVRVVILMFDVTAKDSFDDLDGWMREASRRAYRAKPILCGNKVDLPVYRRVIPAERAKEYAEKNEMPYVEISVRTNEGVEALWDLVVQLLDPKPPPKPEPPTPKQETKPGCALS